MARTVAFLRGMNLGDRRITNDELERHVEDAGFDGVQTYRASGNVILDEPGQPAAEVEAALEAHLAAALGYRVDTYVRAMTELAMLLESDALDGAAEAGFKVHVIFLKEPVHDAAAAELAALEGPDDRFRPLGREVLWLRRGRLSDAAIGTRELEKALGPLQTMRTLSTVRRVVEKFGEDPVGEGG